MKREINQKSKLSGQAKTRIILLYVSVIIILVGLIGTGVFLFLNLGNSEKSYAGSTYSSNATGNWTTGAIWVGGVAPPETNINGDNITINSNHVVTTPGALDVKNNAIFTISSNGTLIITGDLIVDNNLVLNVSGLLIIKGNLQTKNGANITINGGGTTKISGTTSFDNNTALTVNGSLQLGSTPSFGNGSTFSGSGVVKVVSGGCSIWAGPGSCSTGVLPVRLLNFIADQTGNGTIMISWKTAAEENNDFFTVQRTADGKSYTTIATIKGGGNSKTTLSYECEDKTPLEGRSYYRLSQTDYDGKTETFAPVAVNLLYGTQQPSAFNIFPNPLVGNVLNVVFVKPEQGSIEIVDGKGKQIFIQNIDGRQNELKLILEEAMQPGVYIVSYKTATTHENERLVKQ